MLTLTFRKPRLVALTLLVIIAAGVSAVLTLGRQEDPTITNLNAVITTVFPGADPARVEALVTDAIEEEMREISEIKTVTSSSATGVSIIGLELAETTDPDIIDQVWSRARDAVDDAALTFPPGVLAPDFDSEGIAAMGAIFAIQPSSDRVPEAVLTRYADALSDVIRNTFGTKSVESFGAPEEEVEVRLDPAKTAALGLTPDRVAALIAAADTKVQSGRVLTGQADVLLDVAGDVETLDRLREIVLVNGPDGQITRLSDIATVERSVLTPRGSVALVDGAPAILLGAQIEEGLQVDVWMERLQRDVAEFEQTLPASLSITQIFDQAVYTQERLTEVGINMAIGIGLVILVLLVTLGVRAALIVAAVLPLVSLATIATMNFIGLPLHQMSVTGLIVALGLLVDAAIVMTDEIRQRLARGMARLEAVGEAVQRLAAPLLASTVTTALSFVPMILLPGGAGDFVGSIAIAVVLMLCWSLVIALTITPALAGRLLPEGERAKGFGNGIPSGWVGRRFRSTLVWSLNNPVRAIALALVLPFLGFASFPTLVAQFFPGVDRDQFHIEVEMAPGGSLDRTRALVARMDAALAGTEGIRQVAWTVGESAPAFYYNIVGSRQNEPTFAQALITTDSPETTNRIIPPLQEQLSTEFPEARIIVRGLVQGPPVDAPIEFRLIGPDLAILRERGEEARRILLSLPDISAVRASLEGGAPEVSVTVDEAKARLLGLTSGDVARQMQSGLDGVVGGSLLEGSEQLPIRVRLGDGLRGDLNAISDMLIVLPGGDVTGQSLPAVPLSALAEIELMPSASTVSRRNGERINTVQAFIPPSVLPEQALVKAQAALDEAGFAMPPGFRLEFGGDADARDETIGNLLAPLGLIITLSIAAIVLTFNSFRLSAITLVVAVLSAGLSLLALAVFQFPFGIQAIIGVIGSIGVSINAAIIILTGMQGNRGAMDGNTDAMADVLMGSSRHIISTTLTTFGGFVPLILSGGGFWPPFAMSIAGGVLLSTVVSFYFTPPMFRLLRPRTKAAERAEEPSPAPAKLEIAAQ